VAPTYLWGFCYAAPMTQRRSEPNPFLDGLRRLAAEMTAAHQATETPETGDNATPTVRAGTDAAVAFTLARALRDHGFRRQARAVGYVSGQPLYAATLDMTVGRLLERLDANPGPHVVAVQLDNDGWRLLKVTIDVPVEEIL
jgi:hypothetical protein